MRIGIGTETQVMTGEIHMRCHWHHEIHYLRRNLIRTSAVGGHVDDRFEPAVSTTGRLMNTVAIAVVYSRRSRERPSAAADADRTDHAACRHRPMTLVPPTGRAPLSRDRSQRSRDAAMKSSIRPKLSHCGERRWEVPTVATRAALRSQRRPQNHLCSALGVGELRKPDIKETG